MAYEIHYGGMRGGKTECMSRAIKYAKLVEQKPFLKIGEIGELNGVYYQLSCIDNTKGKAYLKEIEIHKLKTDMNGYVELDE